MEQTGRGRVPRMASTVLVLAPIEAFRDAPQPRLHHGPFDEYPPQQYRILFVKRSSKMAFMANRYVFPGGVIEDADGSDSWKSLVYEQAASESTCGRACMRFDDSISRYVVHDDPRATRSLEHFAYRIGGLRELFEETGVLLSHKEWRKVISADASRFLSLAETLGDGIVPSIATLHLWSRWVTPPSESRRYDTWFYIAPLCRDMRRIPDCVSHDGHESVHLAWFTPTEALHAALSGDILLAPPTLYTLVELVDCRTADDVIARAHKRQRVAAHPIHPVMFRDGATEADIVVAMPGDVRHPDTEPHDRASGARNRIVRSAADGRWRVMRKHVDVSKL